MLKRPDKLPTGLQDGGPSSQPVVTTLFLGPLARPSWKRLCITLGLTLGVIHADDPGRLGDQSVMLAEVLEPAGYATYACGKWHANNPPLTRRSPCRCHFAAEPVLITTALHGMPS